MNLYRLKYALQNQSLGLLPIVVFLLVAVHLSYLTSFILSAFFSLVNLFIYLWLFKRGIYQFGLLCSTAVLMFYALFLSLQIQDILYNYAYIIIEILFVIILIFTRLFKKIILNKFSNEQASSFKSKDLNNALDEFFFFLKIGKNALSLHLLFFMLYGIVTYSGGEPIDSEFWGRRMMFILFVLIGIYEGIRLFILFNVLDRESWLPILDADRKVTGHIAESISHTMDKKLYHPIVRVAVLCNDMLYLTKHSVNSTFSPNKFDLPFHRNVYFDETVDEALQKSIEDADYIRGLEPHHLIGVDFENDEVKLFISLYVIRVSTEHFNSYKHPDGKLWSSKQIEENMGKGIFSEFFEKEYEYFSHTILNQNK
jgi:hypothetical protein